MFRKNIKGCTILGIGAMIWGTAFIFQSLGTDYLGPFTFNFCRSILAAIILLPVTMIFGEKRNGSTLSAFNSKKLLISGMLTGAFLFGGLTFQQIGIADTSSGKTAFITAMYIIFAPIVNILFKKKPGFNSLFGMAVGLIGMYFLCMSGESSFSLSDLLVLACAFMFTGQIIVIDIYSAEVDCVKMSFIQFFVCAILSLPFMIFIEHPTLQEVTSCSFPLLYTGIMSGAVAYTLQIIGQKYADVTPATLTMSLESVFAAIAGYVILHEKMTALETLGCVLIFMAVIISQIPFNTIIRNKKAK